MLAALAPPGLGVSHATQADDVGADEVLPIIGQEPSPGLADFTDGYAGCIAEHVPVRPAVFLPLDYAEPMPRGQVRTYLLHHLGNCSLVLHVLQSRFGAVEQL